MMGAGMDIRVVVAVSDESVMASTESLIAWLHQEPELRGRVQTLVEVPEAGDMGTVLDVATVALGAGGALSVLAMSLRTWFAQPRRSDARIEIRHPDGRSVVVDAKRVDNVEALLEALLDTDG